MTYFFVSSYWQGKPIGTFIRKARHSNPGLYRHIVLQYVIWALAHGCLAALAIALHGPKIGAYVYLMTCAVPALFALWTIMLFNYEQHVHTDPWSKYNHSRSWDGRLLNFFLFNNGLHAAHHEKPGLHWSKLRALHEVLAPAIDPRLIHRSMFGYFFRQYVLAVVVPRLGTKQVGRAPYDPPDGRPLSLETADVDVGEAGANAQMMPG